MKISKLFHWLYCFLMLMPLFSVLVSSLYVVFNDNANLSYSSSQYVHTFEPIDSYLYFNKNYYFNTDSNIISQSYDVIPVYSNTPLYIGGSLTIAENDIVSFRLYKNNSQYLDVITRSSSSHRYLVFDINSIITFNFEVASNFSVDSVYNDFIKEVDTNVPNFLDNVFTYSLNQLKDNDLYNWSLDSFLSTPFTYILNLFNVPNNSVMLLLLSYWLDISIIWLTFDVLMYVPLLTHRWLDKGVLE